jgi:hypothetical protein
MRFLSRSGPLLALAILCPALGCAGRPPPAGDAPLPGVLWFEDVTDAVGLNFVHDPGPLDGSCFFPQIMGSGAALFDCDGDGRPDILLLQNGGPGRARNCLYRQRRDGTFQDISAGSGLDVAGYGMGVAVGDVDNDGRPDVYLTCYGGDRFFLNQGDGRFRERTREAGLDNPLWGSSAAFFDYDRDGWLDLVVVNYLNIDPAQPCTDATGARVYCHPSTFPGTVTRLYRNRGRDASGRWLGFEDRTLASGLGRTNGPGLGVLCADFNGDGWPDIFVANDNRRNHLWINRKDGTFTEEAVLRGVAYNALGQVQANMGVAWGDVDGDGLPDLFVTHLDSEYNALWNQGPLGQFRDRTANSGLPQARRRGTGFGTVLADFDQDGALDLAVVNGGVGARRSAAPGSYWAPYAQRNQLFGNNGNGVFQDISEANPALCGSLGVWRGLAVGDVDGDGAPDLLVTQIGGRARLLRNVAPRRGHWLLLRVLDPVLNRDAYGAEVRIEARSKRWVRLVQPGQSYLCSNDPRVHFGLGEVDHVEAIAVLWPDGVKESFPAGPVDRLLTLRKGEGRSASSGKGTRP